MSFETPTGHQRQAPAQQAYCRECGSRLEGAKFCPSCGSATANMLAETADTVRLPDGPDTIRLPDAGRPAALPMPQQRVTPPPAPSPPLAPPPVDGERSQTKLVVALTAVLLLLIAAGAAAFIVTSRNGRAADKFPAQARSALARVIAANMTLAARVSALGTHGSPAAAKAAVTAATSAATTAQTTLAGLTATTATDRTLDANAKAALAGELSWLSAAGAVLADPSSSQLSQLASLGVNATGKLTALNATVPGASAHFPSSSAIAAYASAQARAAAAKATTKQFISSISQLLTQSKPAFTQINQLFTELNTVANGGFSSITLPQAEQQISTIVSNRTSLAASARSMQASTKGQQRVKNALVAAMDTSLTDDQAIDNCLNEDNNGELAILWSSCLASTGTDATTANSAKSHFWNVYNALRRSVGKPATHSSF